VLFLTPARCVLSAPLTPSGRSLAGLPSLGVLMTLVDIGASDPAMVASRPDWNVTLDLSMHRAAPLAEGPMVVDSRLLRAGKKLVVVAANAFDGRGEEDLAVVATAIDRGSGPTLAASGLITFARVPRSAAPGMDGYDPALSIGEVRHHPVDAPPDRPMFERMNLVVVDAHRGMARLESTPYVVNSVGTINGGALAVFVEAAAEAMRPGMAAGDIEIHYLSQVKVGPAETAGAVLRESDDLAVVNVRVTDAGNEGQLLALATVTLQRQSGAA
jgi:acyl-coenzyme A thioesterase PaaI-like protein